MTRDEVWQIRDDYVTLVRTDGPSAAGLIVALCDELLRRIPAPESDDADSDGAA